MSSLKPLLKRIPQPGKRAAWTLLALLLVAAVIITLLPPQPVSQAPAPQDGAAQSTGSPVMMVIGAILMLSPIAWIAWQSRGKKEPDIRSSCCLPVIDESKRPFRPDQDEEDGAPQEVAAPQELR